MRDVDLALRRAEREPTEEEIDEDLEALADVLADLALIRLERRRRAQAETAPRLP